MGWWEGCVGVTMGRGRCACAWDLVARWLAIVGRRRCAWCVWCVQYSKDLWRCYNPAFYGGETAEGGDVDLQGVAHYWRAQCVLPADLKSFSLRPPSPPYPQVVRDVHSEPPLLPPTCILSLMMWSLVVVMLRCACLPPLAFRACVCQRKAPKRSHAPFFSCGVVCPPPPPLPCTRTHAHTHTLVVTQVPWPALPRQ